MKTWQYFRHEAYSNELMQMLDKYGREGWEAFAVVPWSQGTGSTAYFKRPVEPSESHE